MAGFGVVGRALVVLVLALGLGVGLPGSAVRAQTMGFVSVTVSRCSAPEAGDCVLVDGALVELTQDGVVAQQGPTGENGLVFDVVVGGSVAATVLAGGPEGYVALANPMVVSDIADGSSIAFVYVPPSGGGETPGGETPGGEAPGGEIPGGEVPGGEEPGGETPGSETPQLPVQEPTGGEVEPSAPEAVDLPGLVPQAVEPAPVVVVTGLPNTGSGSGYGPQRPASEALPALLTMLGIAIAAVTAARDRAIRLARRAVPIRTV